MTGPALSDKRKYLITLRYYDSNTLVGPTAREQASSPRPERRHSGWSCRRCACPFLNAALARVGYNPAITYALQQLKESASVLG